MPFCRLKLGEIWTDPISGHKVGCLDASNQKHVLKLMQTEKAKLSIQDPPYSVVAGNNNTKNLGKIELVEFIYGVRLKI